MQPLHRSSFRYRSMFARIILLTLEEALGHDVLNAVLYSAGLHHFISRYPTAGIQPSIPVTEIQALFAALETLHSANDMQRLAHQCGQAIARSVLAAPKSQEPAASPPPIQALPLPARQQTGLQILSDLLSEFSVGHHLHVTPGSSGYLFVLEMPGGGQPDAAIHHLMLGFLAEGMRIFALGEREYQSTLVELPGRKTGLYLHSLAG